MIKVACRMLALASLLIPAAALATKVPVPIEGVSVNINMQVQPEFLVQEGGAPAGDSPSFDIFVRRTRAQFVGDITPYVNFYLNIDNGNFGKYGNFTSRMIVQDAWASFTPWGKAGGNALFIDVGLMQIPLSHYTLGSTTNYITADLQTDAIRMPGNPLQAFRDTGLQLRGWLMDKKLGFRLAVTEGYEPIVATCTPTVPGSCVNPNRNPAFHAFLNFVPIGTEEGGYYYGGSYRWGKDPILSVNAAVNYQSRVLRNAFSSLTDQKLITAGIYADVPSGDTELVGEVTAYVASNGTGSANTGLGLSGNLGYRFHNIAPYIGVDYFQSATCGNATLTTAQTNTCNATIDTADSRNLKAGLNVFLSKSQNHFYVEFQVNHGQSQFGPSSITAASAGYVPLSLDPAAGSAARRPFNNLLATQSFRSLLVHWNFFF